MVVSIIIAVSVIVSALIMFATFEYEEYEETVIVTTLGQPAEITTTSSPTETHSTFMVPLDSGNYLECTKTTSINCITPGSRKISSHRKYHSRSGGLKETSIIVSIKKKFNQPIVYYNFPSSVLELSYFSSLICIILIM